MVYSFNIFIELYNYLYDIYGITQTLKHFYCCAFVENLDILGTRLAQNTLAVASTVSCCSVVKTTVF